jgi:hypothetical protein
MANDISGDETFHPAGDDPYWNESGWFGFAVPERDINGFVYYFHDVRTGIAGGGPALWDPTGEEVYDCLFYDWRWQQPPTGALHFADFTLPNSLRHTVVEPAHRYRLSYDAPGLELDLEWSSLMAPHTLGDGAGGAPHHFDQPGRMAGSLVLDGERVDVDCYSMRDRTWGPHHPGARRPGDYLWAIASPEQHWHTITVAGREAGVDVVIGGYLMRDGELGELVKGTRRVLSRRAGAARPGGQGGPRRRARPALARLAGPHDVLDADRLAVGRPAGLGRGPGVLPPRADPVADPLKHPAR